MRFAVTLCLTVLICSVKAGFDPERFPGPFCNKAKYGGGLLKQPECCTDRNDNCYRSIGDQYGNSSCYCDKFCKVADDCCPDFDKEFCSNYRPPITTPTTTTETPGTSCNEVGAECWRGCNRCRCHLHRGEYKWRCDEDVCINDQKMIDDINRNGYRWTATEHNKFERIKLKDGIYFYLGTKPSEMQVLDQLSITHQERFEPKDEFDARNKWPFIQPPLDQGVCGASWAYSTAGVATDRINMKSKKNDYSGEYGAKQLLTCVNPGTFLDLCREGTVIDAWWYLRRPGLVNDRCYRPYINSFGHHVGKCEDFMQCQDGEFSGREIITPVYRIANDERAIQREIFYEGPVQATMKVRADFFLYEGGVYSFSGISDPLNTEAYHSVRIIGWGVEKGVKYWLVANSWGTQWGERGLFKIRRGENESEIESFVIGGWVQERSLKRHQSSRFRHEYRHKSLYRKLQ